jgi:hypothetical protein
MCAAGILLSTTVQLRGSSSGDGILPALRSEILKAIRGFAMLFETLLRQCPSNGCDIKMSSTLPGCENVMVKSVSCAMISLSLVSIVFAGSSSENADFHNAPESAKHLTNPFEGAAGPPRSNAVVKATHLWGIYRKKAFSA